MKPLHFRNKRRALAPAQVSGSQLARWQSIASIAASIAIPLILAVFGFLVQRQVASEGLKKDYVQIATSILKENPSGQDADLRKWAVDVLDRNADIPFSSRARESLEKGYPLVRSHFVFPDPPSSCMTSPKKTNVFAMIQSAIKPKYIEIENQKKFLQDLAYEAAKAEENEVTLKCLQSWLTQIKKSTTDLNEREYSASPATGKGPVRSSSAP